MVTQDNKTRWNSIYCMIQRAFLLKDSIDIFVKRAREKPPAEKPLPVGDEISRGDWDVLALAKDILQPFFDMTIHLQGRAKHAMHGSLWEALPTLDFLLNKLEEKSREYGVQFAEAPAQITESAIQPKESSKRSTRKKAVQVPAEECTTPEIATLQTCVNSCWLKLRKYYELMDRSPVYAAAVFINPQHKWNYFDTHWADQPEWITQAKESVEELWRTMYANPPEAESETGHEDGLNSDLFFPTPRKEPSNFDQWVQRARQTNIRDESDDEYEQYIKTDHFSNQQPGDANPRSQIKSVDLCAFWARYERCYPSLARMAFDILSIPAMSAECERVFSSAKLLITDRRGRLKEDIIEASECSRSWIEAELEAS
jgi:hypothetical protein